MFGWEYPPNNSGGLGIACKGIVDGLLESGVKINLVLPENNSDLMPSFCVNLNKTLNTEDIKLVPMPILNSSAYISNKEYNKRIKSKGLLKKFSKSNNLVEDSVIYGSIVGKLALKIPHDVIHVHDWLTIPAGIEAKKLTNKPLVIHIHSTEFDRSGGNPNPAVYKIEKQGFDNADLIMAVSNFTKQKIIDFYGIPEDKIRVVHNAINQEIKEKYKPHPINKNNKIVLFLGRITIQKGPDYFVEMAKKVLDEIKNVKFVIAGNGDMMNEIISRAIKLGVEKNIIFTGFLKGSDIDKAFQQADVYVMPSISEPFGLTALESIQNGTPVIISRQSGVSEVLSNVLKVDFWDVNEMANKVISILKYPALDKCLKKQSAEEIKKFSWTNAANKIKNIYINLINNHA
jgi:glycosyltransferase involved in cell wall biosynthesis